MLIKRTALGIRFDFLNMVPDDKIQQLVFEELFSVLTLPDLVGLDIYGGVDKYALPSENIYMVVIVGGKLGRMRRIFNKILHDAAISMYLCHTQPFYENNRLSEIDEPPYFGQVGKDGLLHGGNVDHDMRISRNRGRTRNIGNGIHILLSPSALGPVCALEAVKRLTFAARRSFPGVRILPLPIIQGEGCALSLAKAVNGNMHTAISPSGEKLQYGVLRGRVAVIEARANSADTGLMIRRALDEGLKKLYILPCKIDDDGMGCARTLGVKFFNTLGEAAIDRPVPDMQSDAELLHPAAANARFVLMCSNPGDTLGSLVMNLLNVQKQDAVEAMLDASGFVRLLTGKALVITGGSDILSENSLGQRVMRSVSTRCSVFNIPVIVMSCSGWNAPSIDEHELKSEPVVVKIPLSPAMTPDEAGRVFDETAQRIFRFIRLGRDVEKIGAPKKEPRRTRYLPYQLKKRFINEDET